MEKHEKNLAEIIERFPNEVKRLDNENHNFNNSIKARKESYENFLLELNKFIGVLDSYLYIEEMEEPVNFTRFQKVLVEQTLNFILEHPVDTGKSRNVPKSLRFDVLHRDEFKCQYCGKNVLEDNFHVDHVLPYSFGGKTELNNLVTSCEECNLGKSNKLLKSEILQDKIRKNIERIVPYLSIVIDFESWIKNEIDGLRDKKILK